MKLQLATAYAASLARVAAWAAVAGLVYRYAGPVAFAAFSLQRAVLTVLMLTGLGLAPALVVCLPAARQRGGLTAAGRLFDTGLSLALVMAATLTIVAKLALPSGYPSVQLWTLAWYGAGGYVFAAAVRLVSDCLGASLQTGHHLAADYGLQAITDAGWAVAVCLAARPSVSADLLEQASGYYTAANLALLLARWTLVRNAGVREWLAVDRTSAALLLGTGLWLLLAQAADLLYGPANQALIGRLLGPEALATYAPLLHIDAALLLGVGGLANLLLPRTAVAHGAGDLAAVRRQYVAGSLASLGLLVAGAAVATLAADPLFRWWFGQPLPATQAVLPLVLIHTVVGGTAAVGRSVLFGIGRARAYTVAALIGGGANVALAYVLVHTTSLGLRGVVLATIITVALRCGFWLPWYTLRCLRSPERSPI